MSPERAGRPREAETRGRVTTDPAAAPRAKGGSAAPRRGSAARLAVRRHSAAPAGTRSRCVRCSLVSAGAGGGGFWVVTGECGSCPPCAVRRVRGSSGACWRGSDGDRTVTRFSVKLYLHSSILVWQCDSDPTIPDSYTAGPSKCLLS